MDKKGDKIARAKIVNAKGDELSADYDPKKVSELAEHALIKEIDSVDDINDLDDLDDEEKDLLVRAIGSASVEEPNIQFANKKETTNNNNNNHSDNNDNQNNNIEVISYEKTPTYNPYTVTINDEEYDITSGSQEKIDQKMDKTWIALCYNKYDGNDDKLNGDGFGLYLATHKDIGKVIEGVEKIEYTDTNGKTATYDYIGMTDLLKGGENFEIIEDEYGNFISSTNPYYEYMKGIAGEYIVFQTCIDNSGRSLAYGYVFEKR